MRTLGALLAFLAACLVGSAATADERSACLAACETAARSCYESANTKYDACKPAANKGCAPVLPAEKFECLSSALKSCARTRSAETEPCPQKFEGCYAACGPRPSGTVDFWCMLDADSPASNAKVRKYALCGGPQGLSGGDQHAHCMKLFTPKDPAMGFSLDCAPLP